MFEIVLYPLLALSVVGSIILGFCITNKDAGAKFVWLIFTFLLCVASSFSIAFATSWDYEWNVNCTGRLKRAADASSIELATKELDSAINYIEKKGTTKGNTSIFFEIPSNDLEYWYTNLCTTREELKNLKPNASDFEKSNMLMKLRETLLDHDKEGESVTHPSYLSLYPKQWLSAAFLLLFIITALTLTCCGAVIFSDV